MNIRYTVYMLKSNLTCLHYCCCSNHPTVCASVPLLGLTVLFGADQVVSLAVLASDSFLLILRAHFKVGRLTFQLRLFRRCMNVFVLYLG